MVWINNSQSLCSSSLFIHFLIKPEPVLPGVHEEETVNVIVIIFYFPFEGFFMGIILNKNNALNNNALSGFLTWQTFKKLFRFMIDLCTC